MPGFATWPYSTISKMPKQNQNIQQNPPADQDPPLSLNQMKPESGDAPRSSTSQGVFDFLDRLPEEEKKEKIQALLRAADALKKSVADLSRAGIALEPADAPDTELLTLLSQIGDQDLLLRFDLRLYSRDVEIFEVSGHNKMALMLTDEMLPEATRNMEVIFYTSLFRPLMSAFTNHINKFVVNENKPIKNITLGHKNDIRSEIPTPNRQGYLSQE